MAACIWCPAPAAAWATFDTPVGAFTVDLCEGHLAQPPRLSALEAVELVIDHPAEGVPGDVGAL